MLDVLDVSPDPRTGRFKAVNFVDVAFSEPINFSTLDINDVALTRDGGPNLIDNTVTIERLSETTARISNLGPLTNSGGLFTFTVGGTIADVAGKYWY